MKIAMIGHKRMPSREGGVEIVVEALSVHMAAKGHDITVYNRRGHHIGGREFQTVVHTKQYKGVRIIQVPTIDIKGLAAVTSSFFATILAICKGYDCIHYHAEGPAFMVPLAHWAGIPTIVTIHGLDWQRSKWHGFASWFLLQGERMAVRYADEIIVLSENAKQYFQDTYQRATTLIPNGIHCPIQKPADEIARKWNLKKDQYILYLGRIVPEKGLDCLIQAFQKVKTDKKLVIAGSSSNTQAYYQSLQHAAAGDNRIIFTGFVQGRVLDELYSNAYLYCLPSYLEGMPISLLEAMSYGNCCVTTDIPECTFIVQSHGFSFPKGDTAQLEELLRRLCASPALIQQKRQGVIDAVCNQYNWDDIAERTLRVYRRSVHSKNKIKGKSHESFDGE